MPTNPTEQIDAVAQARELLDAIDKSARVGYAFKLLKILIDEVERLRRGEFICQRCYLRKDAEFERGDF